jgi:hypothetical protein
MYSDSIFFSLPLLSQHKYIEPFGSRANEKHTNTYIDIGTRINYIAIDVILSVRATPAICHRCAALCFNAHVLSLNSTSRQLKKDHEPDTPFINKAGKLYENSRVLVRR